MTCAFRRSRSDESLPRSACVFPSRPARGRRRGGGLAATEVRQPALGQCGRSQDLDAAGPGCGGALDRCDLHGAGAGRRPGLRGRRGGRGLLPGCDDAPRDLEGGHARRRQKLQQRLLAGPGGPLPALRHHGRRLLRPRCGYRQRGPPDRLRRAHLQHTGGRQLAGLLRHARLPGLRPHARRPGRLEMGLRASAPGLLRQPLERGRVGPVSQRPRDQPPTVPLLPRHGAGRPHARRAGRRLAGLAGRPRPTSQSPPDTLPIHRHARPFHRRRRHRLPAVAFSRQ